MRLVQKNTGLFLGLFSLVILEALSLGELLFLPYRSIINPPLFVGLYLLGLRTSAIVSPLLLVGLLYFPIAMVILKSGRFGLFARLSRSSGGLSEKRASHREGPGGLVYLGHPRLTLLIAIFLAGLVSYVSYLRNPSQTTNLPGIDTPLYLGWLHEMLRRPFGDALGYALAEASQGSKPLLLVILYTISSGGFQPELTVRLLPLVLGPILAFSSYFFVYIGMGTEEMAGFAAILTAFSFNVTVGVWAGYYANWLALAESFLFLGVLLSLSRFPSKAKYASLTVLSIGLLLTHPQTWMLIIVVSTLFAFSVWKEKRDGSLVRFVLFVAATGFSADVLRMLTFGAYGATSATLELTVATVASPILQLVLFWPSLIEGFTLNYDGLLANSVLIAMALLFAVRLRLRDPLERLLFFWVLSAAIPFLFLDSFLQTRIVFDLPVSILAAGGLSTLSSVAPSRIQSSLVVLCVILFNANYAVRSMMQL